jgi:hypothetical protein
VIYPSPIEEKNLMAKQKLMGVLESESILLEPVSETRYQLQGEIGCDLIGFWVTVAGEVEGGAIANVAVIGVEKNSGRATRVGTIVATAPNLPPEANGAGGYLYQPKKGRYYLLSSGAPDKPVQGDFSTYIGHNVKVSGELRGVCYILYNAKVAGGR